MTQPSNRDGRKIVLIYQKGDEMTNFYIGEIKENKKVTIKMINEKFTFALITYLGIYFFCYFITSSHYSSQRLIYPRVL